MPWHVLKRGAQNKEGSYRETWFTMAGSKAAVEAALGVKSRKVSGECAQYRNGQDQVFEGPMGEADGWVLKEGPFRFAVILESKEALDWMQSGNAYAGGLKDPLIASAPDLKAWEVWVQYFDEEEGDVDGDDDDEGRAAGDEAADEAARRLEEHLQQQLAGIADFACDES